MKINYGLRVVLFVMACFASAAWCVPPASSGPTADVKFSKDGNRFYVHHDNGSNLNHGDWTNYMPEWSSDMLQISLDDKKDPASGTSAVRVDVKFSHPWVGVAVASYPNAWGDRPCPFYNLSNAEKLVFYAKGARGGETIQVKVAITGDKPFGDSAPFPAATNWITLKDKWQKYELPLNSYNLERVITPFVFVTDKSHNSGSEEMTFFLDEIFFVTSANK